MLQELERNKQAALDRRRHLPAWGADTGASAQVDLNGLRKQEEATLALVAHLEGIARALKQQVLKSVRSDRSGCVYRPCLSAAGWSAWGHACALWINA